MRHCRIVTWILIFSTINLALGAPTAVRVEMSVDMDVAEGGTATSQKRYYPPDDWSITNAEDHPAIPSSLTPMEVDQLWNGAGQGIDGYGPTPDSPMSTASVNSHWPDDYAPSNPGPSRNSFPSQPEWPVNPSALPSTGPQLTPQSLMGGTPLPHPEPSEDGHPSRPDWPVNLGATQSIGHELTPQILAGASPLPALPHPVPSQDHSSSTNLADWSENPGSLWSTANTPTADTPTRPSPTRGPLRDSTLDEILRGRLKRRISGPDTVYLAQRDPRSNKFSGLMMSLSFNVKVFDRFSKFPRGRRGDARASESSHGPTGQPQTRKE